VRVPEAAQRPGHAVAVPDVGRVRVALLIGVGVVLAVIGDPVDHRTLHRQRPQKREQVARGWVRLKGAVRQHAMKADGHPVTAHEIHQYEDGDVGPAEPITPQQRDDGGGDGEGQEDCGHVHTAL
jgi:hypothetical protein